MHSFGLPLNPLGPLGCPKRFSQIRRKLDAQFRANVSIHTRLRKESSLPELASGACLVARGLALGCLWLECGAHLPPFWLPLDPLGALGCPKRFSQICRKLDAQFRANVSICTRLRIESSLPDLASGARPARPASGASGNGVTERCSDPPSHAPGARIT